MNRRQLLKVTASGGLLIALGGGYSWWHEGVRAEDLTIAAARIKLDALTGNNVISSGQWNPTQIFDHCAQSVEYSMSGFPQHKSSLFKNTAGYAAFSVFSSRGRMTHGLSEAIPGAPYLAGESTIQVALVRLQKAMDDFQQYQDELQPHFAYGRLTKEQYEVAHVIHLNNHLEEIAS
ncbi:MAG: DUF1569 domain-containing protein [Halioglobus sp.]